MEDRVCGRAVPTSGSTNTWLQYCAHSRTGKWLWRYACNSTNSRLCSYQLPSHSASSSSTRPSLVRSATCLRACYALPGTDIASCATCPLACYARLGTDISRMLLPAYAMSGTD
eukprot:3933395-Rhodomonas_salina.2